MNPWRKPVAGAAFVLVSLLIIAILPFTSLAAPQGASGTPSFLPLVVKNGLQTATATATPTPTATVTPTVTPTPTITPTPTQTLPAPAAVVTVGAGGLTVYSPKTITITVGDVVQWTWAASFHTVTSGTFPNPDNRFCSPDNLDCPGVHTSDAGAIYEHQFGTAGTFTYFCEIHGGFGMTGTVVVLP